MKCYIQKQPHEVFYEKVNSRIGFFQWIFPKFLRPFFTEHHRATASAPPPTTLQLWKNANWVTLIKEKERVQYETLFLKKIRRLWPCTIQFILKEILPMHIFLRSCYFSSSGEFERLYMRRVAWFGTICTIEKNVENTHERVLLLVKFQTIKPATLLEVALLHG